MARLTEIMEVLDTLPAKARDGAVERSLATDEDRLAYGTYLLNTTADYQHLWGCRDHGTPQFDWDGTLG